MQTHHYIALAIIAALCWAFLVLIRKSPEDRASGTFIGQVSPEDDSFHHGGGPQTADRRSLTASEVLLRRCAWCRRMQGEQPVFLIPGTTVEITDGLCPACERKHFPLSETEQWVKENTMITLPETLRPQANQPA